MMKLIALALLVQLCVAQLCPEYFEDVNGKGCFHFNNTEPQDWQGSRDYCMGLGGDLAVFENCSIFKDVIFFIHLNRLETELEEGEFYWVGATDSGQEGVWNWVNYSPVALGPPLWGSEGNVTQPSDTNQMENCAAMSKDFGYYIFDEDCFNNTHHYSLCSTDYNSTNHLY